MAAREDSGGGREGRGDMSLEDRLATLDLVGDEEEALDFSEEIEELVKEVRWLALFRVHTTKAFSHSALLNAMRIAWSAAKEVTFKVKGDNLFLVQFHCLGDWTRVMEGGPWLFRGAPVVLEEYDGFSNIHEYKLNRIPVWTRIQGIPDGLMKSKEIAEKVARKVGEPPVTVMVDEGRINPTSYLRARVQLDKALVRVITITLKDTRKYLVQYEKLPNFCYVCGIMGHELTECGDGVHDANKCGWGEWLLVRFLPTSGHRAPNRGGGRSGGRGRGRGRGWADSSVDSEMEDIEEEEGEKAQDRVIVPSGKVAGSVANAISLLENAGAGSSPPVTQEKKRQRQENPNVRKHLELSATSFEEDRREQ